MAIASRFVIMSVSKFVLTDQEGMQISQPGLTIGRAISILMSAWSLNNHPGGERVCATLLA
jgi:hypothetical protein